MKNRKTILDISLMKEEQSKITVLTAYDYPFAQLMDRVGIDMIQMRNLSIDPQLYWKSMGAKGSGIGMKKMLDRVKKEIPQIQYGYFNRTN